MKTKQLKIEKSIPNFWVNKWVVVIRPTDKFEEQILESSGFAHYPFNITDLMESFVEVVFVIADTREEAMKKAGEALKKKGFPEYSYGDVPWYTKFIMKAFKAPGEYALMFIEPVKVFSHNSSVFRNQLMRMW